MSWEISDIKREIQCLKNSQCSKVEKEEFRRELSELESKINRIESNLQEEIRKINEKIDNFIESQINPIGEY